MSEYPVFQAEADPTAPRRLSSHELAAILLTRCVQPGRVLVSVNHEDGGSSMYGFALAQQVDLWTVPQTSAFSVWEEGGGWISGPSPWAGHQVVLVSGGIGACPDSDPGDEERALADPRAMTVAQLCEALAALPDLPVALAMYGDPDLPPLDSMDSVDWACHPDDCTVGMLQDAGPRPAQVEQEEEEETMVEWPAVVDLWNSETCWVRE